MTGISPEHDLADTISVQLPYLRRYARALTGSQASGDTYAAATLEAIVQDPSEYDRAAEPKLALFRTFHAIWESTGSPIDDDDSGPDGKIQSRFRGLTEGTREVLLLHTMEEFRTDQIAEIIATTQEDVESRLAIAYEEISKTSAGRILIIEDETIIAMDLQAIVADLGHRITGVARTATQAVELGKAERPDLVLADIHLADDSSGIDAVNELLAHFGELPVIFITAYPERLLTGKRPEPAFLIAKPYSEDQVRSAVSHAMFFSSTETLGA